MGTQTFSLDVGDGNSGFTYVTITGTIERQPGTPAVGAIVGMMLSHAITDGVADITPLRNTAVCDSEGDFSLGPIRRTTTIRRSRSARMLQGGRATRWEHHRSVRHTCFAG